MNDLPPDPPKPLRLPRLHGDTIEERAEVEWDGQLYDGTHEIPPIPEAFLAQFKASRHHRDYMAGKVAGSIEYDDAKRHCNEAEKKMAVLVEIAKQDRYKWREAPEKSPEEIQRNVDEEIAKLEAKRAAAKEKARLRAERHEIEAGAREHGQDQTEVEQEEALKREEQADRVAAAMGEELRRHPKVVPLRREERAGAGRGERVDDREDPEFKPPQRLDLSRWSVPPEPLVWIAPGFLRPGVSTLFSGRGGAGKGIVSMTLATAMMPGQGLKGFLGMAVLEGPVFGLFCEDEPQILQLRQVPIDKFYGLPHGRFWNERAYYSLVGRFSALAIADKRTNQLMRTPLWDWLLAQVKAFPRLLTILDPVSRLFIGDLNDPLQAVQFSAMLDELAVASGGAVLANFHPSRSALKDTDASDGVGHSPQWVNAFRIAAFLDVPAPAADPDKRVLRTTKINDGSKTDCVLRWDTGLFCLDRGGGPKAGSAHREQFLELFDKAWSRDIWVSAGATSTAYAPKRLLEIGALDATDRAQLAGMKAAMGALLGDGTLVSRSFRDPVQRRNRERLERASTTASTTA